MPVSTIVGHIARGRTEAQVLDDFPYLTSEDIKAALAFAAYLSRGYEVEIPVTA